MKTAGNLIKETRLRENISQEELGEMTHIKKSFIDAIEKSQWDKLPEPAVVTGFVKSISHFLNIDETLTVALLKREYAPVSSKTEKLKNNTKEIGKKFIWGPRLTFFALVILILCVILGYLGFQYRNFNLPPGLTVNEPQNEQLVTSDKLPVTGKTDPDATIIINNEPVIVNGDGIFNAQIKVTTDTQEIKITAKSRSGKVTSITRTIKVQL